MNKTIVPTMLIEAYSKLSTTPSKGVYNDCPTEEWRIRLIIVRTVLYSLTSIFGVMGNGLVIFITGFRMKKTFTTVFFLNLAIADFIATFFLPLTIAFLIHLKFNCGPRWPIGQEMCNFISIIKILNLYSSIFFLMVISMARYIYVRYPVWARNHLTPRLASLVALGVWILSLALSCASMHHDISVIYNTQHINCSYISEILLDSRRICFGSYARIYITMKNTNYSMFISHVILSFILPFIVMISSYGATTLRLRRSRFAQSGKPFKAITAVTVAFFVCWFPLNLITFTEEPPLEKCELLKLFLATRYLSTCLAYFNSCLNPILYVFIGHNYRESLRCSLLSALEDAFQEERSPGRTETENNSSAMPESQNL